MDGKERKNGRRGEGEQRENVRMFLRIKRGTKSSPGCGRHLAVFQEFLQVFGSSAISATF